MNWYRLARKNWFPVLDLSVYHNTLAHSLRAFGQRFQVTLVVTFHSFLGKTKLKPHLKRMWNINNRWKIINLENLQSQSVQGLVWCLGPLCSIQAMVFLKLTSVSLLRPAWLSSGNLTRKRKEWRKDRHTGMHTEKLGSGGMWSL